MKKIPTLFVRDFTTGYVIPEVNPKAECVLEEAYPALRKYDGTCVGLFLSVKGDIRINQGVSSGEIDSKEDITAVWMARHTVPGRMLPPENFIEEEFDAQTGKTFGWIPIEQSSFYKFFKEAREDLKTEYLGTYELCGPKINGNPEGFKKHTLVFHYTAEQLANIQVLDIHEMSVEDAYEALKSTLAYMPVEGVIFKSPMHGMAKLKRKDFNYE
jgi:hypothetical protein